MGKRVQEVFQISPQGKIWLVEDSPLLRAHLRNFLASMYDFEIEEIPSTQKLEHHLASQGLQDLLLLILDIYLADGNGLTVIENYQKSHPRSHIPLVVVSAYIDQETVTRAAQVGAKDMLRKPLDLNLLASRIDSIISEEYGPVGARKPGDFCSPVAQEIKRAQRGKYGTSLLLVKLYAPDGLQLLYQVAGYYRQHEVGKNCLQCFYRALRETDTIVELSPSEFLFVLPFADAAGALVVEDKIESEIKGLFARQEQGPRLVFAAVTFPDDGKDACELIEKLEDRSRAILEEG